jgi:peptidoglycan/xylan/chitin deacetylase (PgdA/CDA1 family)
VPASFYVPAVSAQIHPEEQRRVVGEGHEIGLHGWIHEIPSHLPPGVERDLMRRSSDALEKITGSRPVGIRTPGWDFSSETLDICQEMGLIYDSSLMADEDCYEIVNNGKATGMVEVPVEWLRDDAMYLVNNPAKNLHPYLSPADVFDVFRREFEGAYAEGGLFQMTMHPHVITYRSRIWILEELIRHARSFPGVWFATHRDVAVWARDHAQVPA